MCLLIIHLAECKCFNVVYSVATIVTCSLHNFDCFCIIQVSSANIIVQWSRDLPPLRWWVYCAVSLSINFEGERPVQTVCGSGLQW